VSPKAIAAIDLGTTSCRAEVFSLEGESLGRHAVEYGIVSHEPDAAEQEALGWWSAACECMRQAVRQAEIRGEDVIALGFSTQGHSWVPTDADFRPLRAAFTWLDRRSGPYAEELLQERGAEYWGKLAGKTPGPWHMLPQILWLREHQPHILKAARHLLFAQDFLIARLTGKPVTDCTTAAASLFFDITHNRWDTRLLEHYDLDPKRLPQVAAAGTVVGHLTSEAAAQMGLSTDTVAVTGAQDQKCAALGAGLAPGIGTASLGTATAISALRERPRFDPAVPIPCFPYLEKGTWVLEAALTTTAGAINWLRDALRPVKKDLSYTELMRLAGEAPTGSGGVVFFPYPAGAGTPHMRFDASAAFAGINLSTTASSLARAVLEGCAYEIATALGAMQQAGCHIEQLYVFGGGVRSKLWTQIIAAVVGVPVYACQEAETAIRGAAMLAASGAMAPEQAATFQDALRSPATAVNVSEKLRTRYQALFERYARAREQYWRFQDTLTQEEDR